MWNPRGLPLGEIGAGWLVHAHARGSPLKRGSSFLGPSSSHDACFRITRRLGPTRKWSNTIMHAGGNIGAGPFLVSLVVSVCERNMP